MANKKQQGGRSSSRTQKQSSSRTQKRGQKGTRKEAQRRATPARESTESGSPESGSPGGGRGRRDMVGGSKVYPASGGQAPADAELRQMASWGQGERGAEGYNDSGGSELVPRDGQLLGGLDVGPSGAPITDLPDQGEEKGADRTGNRERGRSSRQQRNR